MSREWRSNTYNVLTRNCNNFSSALAQRLCGVDIPSWVNRAARTGSKFGWLVDLSRYSASSAAEEVRERESQNRRPMAGWKTIGHMTYTP